MKRHRFEIAELEPTRLNDDAVGKPRRGRQGWYHDPEIYAAERRSLFAREWVLLAREGISE